MQDYIIFGHGYKGEVRQYDDNLESIQIVSKPVLLRAGDQTPPGAALKFYELKVFVMEHDGERYNVAAETIPTDEELTYAVLKENPRKVPHRAG